MSYGEIVPCEYCGLPLMTGQIHRCVKEYELKIDALSSECASLREALERIAHVNEPYPLSYCMRTASEALQRAGE